MVDDTEVGGSGVGIGSLVKTVEVAVGERVA
jgi:hypothetical protein